MALIARKVRDVVQDGGDASDGPVRLRHRHYGNNQAHVRIARAAFPIVSAPRLRLRLRLRLAEFVRAGVSVQYEGGGSQSIR